MGSNGHTGENGRRSAGALLAELGGDLGGDASGPVTRIDAHCHSKASDGAAIAALGLINCPECYSEPEAVFDQAMARGMDLVTITDHDTIRGAMTLRERGFERFTVGQEVSVKFPEDRCMLHVLVWGLTPELDEQITKLNLRDDVYQFAEWLKENDLPHACAHPLYIQNGRLRRWHVERAVLLFRAFECLNGAHPKQVSDAMARYLDRLTPDSIRSLASEHDLEPLWPAHTLRGRTGGSDDHGLLNIGKTFTQIAAPQKITDPREFFNRAMAGESTIGGVGGHPALLAHQFATVGAHYFADRLYENRSPTGRYMSSRLLRFAGVGVKSPSKKKVAAYKMGQKLWFGRRKKNRSLPIVRALRKTLKPLLEKYPDLAERLDPDTWTSGAAVSEHERMAEFVQDLSAALSRSMKPSAMKALRKRDPAQLVEHAMSYAILHIAQLPYLVSLFYSNKERNFLDRFEHETSPKGSGVSVLERPMRVSLFTDTIGDVNGVCRFIHNVAERSMETGRDLQVITSSKKDAPPLSNIHNFAPVVAAAIPKYENLDMCLPPVMQILRHVDEHQPDVIHISTPGPVGLVGFLAAKIHKIPVLGVYHTDFPAYVDQLFDDHGMTAACRSFMKLFYRPFSSIFTRSEDYVRSLRALGVRTENIVSLMPGFEATAFHPWFRAGGARWDLESGAAADIDPVMLSQHWTTLGARADSVKVLYVGRVSVEKNMPFLTDAWKKARKKMKAAGVDAELIVVGDGPYRAQMAKELKGKDAVFLGFKHGEELSRIYASSDMFVFPSVTDTLGQVVMESQGSGIPVIVTDQGGPKEVVEEGETGYVIPVDDPETWADRIVAMTSGRDRLSAMGLAAHQAMQKFTLANSFEHFWEVHVEAWHDHLASKGVTPETAARGEPAPVESAGAVEAPAGGA